MKNKVTEVFKLQIPVMSNHSADVCLVYNQFRTFTKEIHGDAARSLYALFPKDVYKIYVIGAIKNNKFKFVSKVADEYW